MNIIKNKKTNSRDVRKENILNIILNTIILLTSVGLIIVILRNLFYLTKNYEQQSLPAATVLIILLLFVFLRFLSYKGKRLIAAHILITILYLLATYMGYRWGIDLPAEILFYVIIIVISGILIGSKMSFINTIVIIATLTIIKILNNNGSISADRSWINEPWGKSDITMTAIIFFIITTVLWLFNRELERSEKELERERDLLELRVEEKTKELKTTQAKEMERFYRLAEFGKISGGLFHDLVNPLTALTLNINKIKLDNENNSYFEKIKDEINQAMRASQKMKDFIISVRKQISFQEEKILFSINKEIEEVIEILNYQLKDNKIDLIFEADKNITIFGNPIKLNQIITNLICNAIDAIDDLKIQKNIIVNLEDNNQEITIKISDNGKGIDSNIVEKIFEPFFSTKNRNCNIGLGLSLIKEIVEESYSGKIKVFSRPGIKTVFTIKLPKQYE
jgi:signal transduction histidine kinase